MAKRLVAYFSASGVTAKKASQLAEATGADIYEIAPAKAYSTADVNWRNPLSRCNREWIKKEQPMLADTDANVEEYDEIYLAFPIWYYTAPLIIKSFLNAYNFDGKKIVLFATSGGSGFGKTVQNLQPCADKAEIVEGAMLNGDIDFSQFA